MKSSNSNLGGLSNASNLGLEINDTASLGNKQNTLFLEQSRLQGLFIQANTSSLASTGINIKTFDSDTNAAIQQALSLGSGVGNFSGFIGNLQQSFQLELIP